MKCDMQDMDTIRFDSASENERIIEILREWQCEHGEDDTAQQLIEMLEEIQSGAW